MTWCGVCNTGAVFRAQIKGRLLHFDYDSMVWRERLRPREVVAGLRVGPEEKAFPFSQLRTVRVVNDRVGGVPVLVIHQPSSDTTTAFDARAKGKVLRFQAVDADASSLTDLEKHILRGTPMDYVSKDRSKEPN